MFVQTISKTVHTQNRISKKIFVLPLKTGEQRNNAKTPSVKPAMNEIMKKVDCVKKSI